MQTTVQLESREAEMEWQITLDQGYWCRLVFPEQGLESLLMRKYFWISDSLGKVLSISGRLWAVHKSWSIKTIVEKKWKNPQKHLPKCPFPLHVESWPKSRESPSARAASFGFLFRGWARAFDCPLHAEHAPGHAARGAAAAALRAKMERARFSSAAAHAVNRISALKCTKYIIILYFNTIHIFQICK